MQIYWCSQAATNKTFDKWCVNAPSCDCICSLLLCQIFLTLVMTFVQISIGKPFADILMLLDVPFLCFAWTRNSLCISEFLYFLKLKTYHFDWFLFTKIKKKVFCYCEGLYKKMKRYKDLKRKPIEAILEKDRS